MCVVPYLKVEEKNEKLISKVEEVHAEIDSKSMMLESEV